MEQEILYFEEVKRRTPSKHSKLPGNGDRN